MDDPEAMVMLSALSHATRFRCYGLLAMGGERSAGDLAGALGIPKNLLSSHVTILQHAGLLTSERRGRSVIYAAHPRNYGRLLTRLQSLVEPAGARDVPAGEVGASPPN